MSLIMLIDNEVELWRVVRRLLPDHQIECCENGQAALERLHAGVRPAVILVDLMMPIMNGLQFREEQLRSPELALIPVVWLSAVADIPDYGEDLEDLPALSKPFSVSALREAIRPYVN